ncbi:MAG TPA: hypothetical protein VF807_12930 [Ktedonobacterales bacterium]
MDSTMLIWLAIGIAIITLMLIFLAWTTLARSAFRAPGNLILSRSPIGMLICGLIAAGACVAIAVTDGDPNLLTWFIIVGFFALLFGASFTAKYLLFWVADPQGLTQQILPFKKSLLWQSIDWIYPTRKTTTTRVYFVKVGKIVEEGYMVEAGPRKRIKIILAKSRQESTQDALLRLIQRQATNAIQGFGNYPAVRERRAQMGYRQR